MATYSRSVRRGLPRVSGGEPWPAAGEATPGDGYEAAAVAAPDPADATAASTPGAAVSAAATEVVAAAETAPAETAETAPALADAQAPTAAGNARIRRGLPRVAGGEPWPPAGSAPATAAAGDAAAAGVAPAAQAAAATEAEPIAHAETDPSAGSVETAPSTEFVAPAAPVGSSAPQAAPAPQAPPAAPTPPVARVRMAAKAPDDDLEVQSFVHKQPAAAPTRPSTPTRPGTATKVPATGASETLRRRIKLAVWSVLGAIVAAGILVLAARGVTTLPGVPEFLVRYPGEYHPVVATEDGFPAWARWSHFLNFFLMALIIRSGWQVRRQAQPPAFWTPKRGGRKISITLWLHTSLDIFWLVNGVLFVVLLFVSGHWARIVPTSWEVFPNALSAMLQYATLDWPTENGWVNYNSVQQLMYFVVIFVAAPVAAITGVRMSEWWPEKATGLSRAFPAPLARALHFPTMLFFVLFIVIHVILVLATGALRNLNHMFAGQDVINWVGFWWFAAGLLITVGAVVAARPLVIAPIASLFGKVSTR